MSTKDGWPEEPVASLGRTPITIHFTGFVCHSVVSLAPIPRAASEGDGMRRESQISLVWSSPEAFSPHCVAEKVLLVLGPWRENGWSPGVKALYTLAKAETERVAAYWAAAADQRRVVGYDRP